MNEAQITSLSALSEALRDDDDLVAVVRSHLYIEIQVNQLIDGLLRFPREIENSRLGWPQRVELSLALGLKKQYGVPLKKLGEIRNKFAHRPDAKLEEKDIKALYESLHQEDKTIVLESYKRTQNQVNGTFEKEFSQLSAKDRYTLIVVTIHSMLQAAVSHATGKPIVT